MIYPFVPSYGVAVEAGQRSTIDPDEACLQQFTDNCPCFSFGVVELAILTNEKDASGIARPKFPSGVTAGIRWGKSRRAQIFTTGLDPSPSRGKIARMADFRIAIRTVGQENFPTLVSFL
jgi:hypothetical protein